MALIAQPMEIYGLIQEGKNFQRLACKGCAVLFNWLMLMTINRSIIHPSLSENLFYRDNNKLYSLKSK